MGCAGGLEGGERLDGRMNEMGLFILLLLAEEKQRMLKDPSYDRLGVSVLAFTDLTTCILSLVSSLPLHLPPSLPNTAALLSSACELFLVCVCVCKLFNIGHLWSMHIAHYMSTFF